MNITTRPQFVAHRNKMYGMLAEMWRQAAHAAKVERRSGALDKRTGQFNGLGDHEAKISRLKADYDQVCEVSRLQEPTQEDFDRAAKIFARWDVFAEAPADGRGGAGRGQGRKAADGKSGDRFNVTIDEDSVRILRSYGDGGLSLGIRRAALLVEREVGIRDPAERAPLPSDAE